jgi:dUTP pyrophosphatase
MQVRIKRIDQTLPLPEYQTDGSVAFDIYSRIDAEIPAHDFVALPTNLIIETPPGYMLMLATRSSSAKKKGLNMRNGIGIIDRDYSGDEDEIHILTQNLTDSPIHISRGERLAQGVFVRVDIAKWDEIDEMDRDSRGGFGSTG